MEKKLDEYRNGDLVDTCNWGTVCSVVRCRTANALIGPMVT